MAFQEWKTKLAGIVADSDKFNSIFVGNEDWIRFINYLRDGGRTEFDFLGICGQKHYDIIGYFSEGMGTILSNLMKRNNECKIRLISPELKPNQFPQDKLNLIALRKMQTMGIEIRVNIRAHARIFIAYSDGNGAMLLGSYDFNKEGLSGDKINAGIFTRHPDLFKAGRNLFEKIWNDEQETSHLDDAYPNEHKKTA